MKLLALQIWGENPLLLSRENVSQDIMIITIRKSCEYYWEELKTSEFILDIEEDHITFNNSIWIKTGTYRE
jgi:hypothetical protein